MGQVSRMIGCLVWVLLVLGPDFACARKGQVKTETGGLAGGLGMDLGVTIGTVAHVQTWPRFVVEGYGLVGGLPGTGSAECPSEVRAYLKRYAQTEVTAQVDIDRLIDSGQTAVVSLRAVIPMGASLEDGFDVQVRTLGSSEALSLDRGWLYTADLRPVGVGMGTQPLAKAEGPVFIDHTAVRTPNLKEGFVLGGARLVVKPMIDVVLNRPDFRTAGAIQNRLNERFGPRTANASSASQVAVECPRLYRRRQDRFLDLVRVVFLDPASELTDQRVTKLVALQASSPDKQAAEIALEAIGEPSLRKLGVLLKASDEKVRLAAARCMLNLGSDRGMDVLTAITSDARSQNRIDAIRAIGQIGASAEASQVLESLLADQDFDVVLQAYEQLALFEPRKVGRTAVARGLLLDEVPGTLHAAIVVWRSGKAQAAVFGGAVSCAAGRTFQSEDGTVTVEARAGDLIVAGRSGAAATRGAIRCPNQIGDLVRVLCADQAAGGGQGGLGLSYGALISLLKQMCDQGFVAAELLAGPLPQEAR